MFVMFAEELEGLACTKVGWRTVVWEQTWHSLIKSNGLPQRMSRDLNGY